MAVPTIYDISSTAWPTQPFPAHLFPQKPASWLLNARQAWTAFEQAESYDAAIRLSRSGTGWTPSATNPVSPSVWYTFRTNAERLQYRDGQQLHVEAYPAVSWIQQRAFGISSTPLVYVWGYRGPAG